MNNTKRVVVLGAGMVGGFIAGELARDSGLSVSACDRDENVLDALPSSVARRKADLGDAASIRAVVEDADVVVGAVPGFLAFRMLEAVIAAGKPIVDISFGPEDSFDLDDQARRAGIPVVIDCGIAPGFSNMLAMRFVRELACCDRIRIYVGGLPVERRWPWQYTAPFSPIDVIEEYTRPARYREHGQVVTRPALSDLELIDVHGIGTLEAFLTDGLPTLHHTLAEVPNIIEKTLRYPGHVDRVRALRETGFFDTQPITIGRGDEQVRVAPRDVAAALLFDAWRLRPGEQELTFLRVIAEGENETGRQVARQCDVLGRTDPATGITSMARMTGIPCVTAARLVAQGRITKPGILAPETIAEDASLYAEFERALEKADVSFEHRTTSPA